MSAEDKRQDEPESKVALSENEERFRLLIDSLQDYSVFPLSVDGRVTNWNLGAERLKGYTTQEALGLSIPIFFPEEENAERVPERILARAAAEGRAEYEGWLVRKDKSQFWGSVILSAMRDQAGRLELKREKLDLVELVRGAVASFEEELRQSGVQVRVHAKGAVEGTWDRMRLEQVIDNLLSNAVKYGKGLPVDLLVSTDGHMAKLVVRDQGVGVAPEDQERLFERFERVRLDQSVTGYGVGLWIVRRVVEAHDGRISIESRLGEGSSFIVQLPSRGQARPERHRETDPEGRPQAFH